LGDPPAVGTEVRRARETYNLPVRFPADDRHGLRGPVAQLRRRSAVDASDTGSAAMYTVISSGEMPSRRDQARICFTGAPRDPFSTWERVEWSVWRNAANARRE
jgi:hypothetical protein